MVGYSCRVGRELGGQNVSWATLNFTNSADSEIQEMLKLSFKMEK